MKLIDTHVHFWDLSNNINSWLYNPTIPNYLCENYSIDSYIKHNMCVPSGVVTVESANNQHTLQEVKWISDIVKAYNIRNTANQVQIKHIAYIDLLQDPYSFETEVIKLSNYNFVMGIRNILANTINNNYSPLTYDITTDNTHLRNLSHNLKLLKQYNLIFNCQMYSKQLLNIVDVLADSGVCCIIDHFGLPIYDILEEKNHWQQMIRKINNLPNVFLKLSGLDMTHQSEYFAIIMEYLLENITFDKLLYASNYPVSIKSDLNIKNFLLWFEKNKLTQHQESFFYTNANNIFGFNI